jgi:hypothetical protein
MNKNTRINVKGISKACRRLSIQLNNKINQYEYAEETERPVFISVERDMEE